MARLTQADLHEMNQTFEERTPQELLRWTREVFGTARGGSLRNAKGGQRRAAT